MKPFSKTRLFVLLGLAAVASAANAQEPLTHKATNAPACSWQAVVAKKNNFVCAKPDLDWSNYRRVELSSVEVTPSNLKKPLSEKQAEKLKSVLRVALEKQLGTPGGGDEGKVLKIKATITEVKRTNVALNVITLAAVQIPVSFGGATTQFELIDGQSGEPVGQITTRGRGRIYEVLASVQTLGHSQKVLKREPKQMSKNIETLRSRFAVTETAQIRPAGGQE